MRAGATREADPKRIFVIRADGTVVSRQSRNSHSHGSYGNLRLLPGDAIVVPEKLIVSGGLQKFANYAQLSLELHDRRRTWNVTPIMVSIMTGKRLFHRRNG